jgi:hypothetical protein
MKKIKIAKGYDSKAVCHDHFAGSFHCVECGGECKLQGTEMAYTALVRAMFEFEHFTGMIIPQNITRQLQQSGVNVDALRRRVCDTGNVDLT